MNKWYTFKKYFSINSRTQTSFEALVYDRETYKLIKDEQNLFWSTFVELVQGTFTRKVVDNAKYLTWLQSGASNANIYKVLEFHDHNAIKNLQDYISWDQTSTGASLMELSDAKLNSMFKVEYKGPELNLDKGMGLSSCKAYVNMEKIYRSLGMVYPSSEPLIYPYAASLGLDIQNTYTNPKAIILLKKILIAIQTSSLDISEYDEHEQKGLERILKCFYDSSKIKNLNHMVIKLKDEEFKVNLDNAMAVYKLYKGDVFNTWQGTPDKVSVNNTFTLVEYPSYSCHANNEDMEIIRNVYHSALQTPTKKIEIVGMVMPDSPKTIYVDSVEVL
jgi:hypothetical protein